MNTAPWERDRNRNSRISRRARCGLLTHRHAEPATRPRICRVISPLRERGEICICPRRKRCTGLRVTTRPTNSHDEVIVYRSRESCDSSIARSSPIARTHKPWVSRCVTARHGEHSGTDVITCTINGYIGLTSTSSLAEYRQGSDATCAIALRFFKEF